VASAATVVPTDEPAAQLVSDGEVGCSGPSAQTVAVLTDTLSRFLRTVGRARSQYLAAAKQDVDLAAQALLNRLVTEGPLRVGALAESVQSDVSTVSRQVAAMVRDGLVERRADAADGRAIVLVPTSKGRDAHMTHVRERNAKVARMLGNWSDDDCRRFTELLARFAADLA
jgi:DNA-binding MarR family transcriptional regulator